MATNDQENGRFPALTPMRLRRLAEEASGLRHRPLRLVFLDKDVSEADYYLVAADDPRGRDGLPVNANETVDETPDAIEGFESVKLKYGKVSNLEVATTYDALFWSDAAIEKFLLDYYLPLKPPEEWLKLYLRVMGRLPNDDRTVYGIGHTYPSVDEEITDDRVHFLTDAGPVPEAQYLREAEQLYEAYFLSARR